MQHNKHTHLSFLTQLLDVFLIELTNWRWSWRLIVITGTLAPLISLIALGFFAHDSGPVALSYVLSGNVVMTLMFNTMNNVTNHITFIRFRGTLDYFGTLPVRKPVLILAIVAAFLLLSLPSLVITISLGVWILGIPWHPSLLILLVIPLCTLPLAGIGALVGSYARSPEEANSLTLVLILLLLGIGPVVVAPNRLPSILIILGRLSPATYASSALRQVLLGPITGELLVDLAMLTGLSVLVFWIVERKMKWRRD